MSAVLQIVCIYLVIMNILAFALFGIDKLKAAKHKWRISEKALFASALLGGSAGAVLGMLLFRHKTKHWYFRYGLPLILALQIAAAVLIIRYLKLI